MWMICVNVFNKLHDAFLCPKVCVGSHCSLRTREVDGWFHRDGYFLGDQKFSDGNKPKKLHTPADGISSYPLKFHLFRVSLFHLSLSKISSSFMSKFHEGASYHKSAYHDPRGIPAWERTTTMYLEALQTFGRPVFWGGKDSTGFLSVDGCSCRAGSCYKMHVYNV